MTFRLDVSKILRLSCAETIMGKNYFDFSEQPKMSAFSFLRKLPLLNFEMFTLITWISGNPRNNFF